MNRFLSASLLATVIFLISCSDDKEPNFPIEPFIESANIRFTEIAGISEPDSLILSFYFRDGDMDLGLDQANTIYLDSPYHVLNYFLEDNGILTRMTTKHKGQRNFLNVLPAQKGKLATARTRNNADFDFLPKYNCADYGYDSLYIKLQDKEIFDETYHYFEKLDNSEGYVLLDTFYVEPNENHFNILIDYLVKQPDGSFVTFDWMHDHCMNFNGVFPILKGMRKGRTIESGPYKIDPFSSKDGELHIAMLGTAFKIFFEGKTIKLRVKIKDQALHDSNIIETSEIQI